MNVRSLYYILLLLPSVTLAQRRMVVVNVESKVPVRDVVQSAKAGRCSDIEKMVAVEHCA